MKSHTKTFWMEYQGGDCMSRRVNWESILAWITLKGPVTTRIVAERCNLPRSTVQKAFKRLAEEISSFG